MTRTEALLAIAKRDGGIITPAAVIEEAKNPESVLHGSFTWDDANAAEKWRVHEAQHLIRECRITVQCGEEKVETYAFVGLSTDREYDSQNNPYRLAADVAKNESLIDIAVNDALNRLMALEAKYRHLKRLDGVWAAIDAATV